MATPTIQIDQVDASPGSPGVSRDDLVISKLVTLTDPANGAGTYFWEMIAKPVGSSATLSGAATSTATFTPDAKGTYLVVLTFDGTDKSFSENAISEKISTQGGCGVKLANGTRIPGAGETQQFDSTQGWNEAMDPVLRAHDTQLPSVNEKTSLGQLDGAAQGTVFYAASTTRAARLAPGTSGQALKSGGPAADPEWGDVAFLDSTPPLDISDSTPATGSSTEGSRCDHVHAHGSRGGAALHAAVTTSANGFMIAADKTKLDGLGSGSAKSLFFPVTASTTYNDYATMSIAATGSGNFTFMVPEDFGSLTSLTLIAVPIGGAAGSGKDIDLASDYGTFGESTTVHSESDTTTTYNLGTADQFIGISVGGVFTSIAADDFCGLQISHNSVGGTVHYLGLIMRYTQA